MGVLIKNGILYGGSPSLQAAAGSHINESGTPTVTTTTSQGVTTFTFDYLKGQAASAEADGIDYDNTESGLTADNVQDAIDEIVGSMGGGSADDITYDNTDSGMQATDVQDAIDELSAGKANGEGLTFFIQNGILCVSTPPEPLVAFSTATDAQIAGILDAYYNGEYTLADIQEVWHVGDTRTVSLSAMEATGVGESHAAQDVEIAIIDFNHDDLQTAISGKTKALITVQQVDCLDTEGYMNSTNTNVGGWTSSARRTWCNNVFYAALPNAWQSMVKTVQKKTSAGNQSDTINTDNDKCWFLSEIEVFNTTSYSKTGEGSQYPYYTTTANRIKKVNGSADAWWLRSPCGLSSANFVLMSSGGSVYYNVGASYTNGLAPAFCL